MQQEIALKLFVLYMNTAGILKHINLFRFLRLNCQENYLVWITQRQKSNKKLLPR